MRSSVARVALPALLALAACELEEVSVPPSEARLALHGVLSASAGSQVVLLERTRNGTISFFAPPFDVEDPVASNEGEAESGATMRLVTPAGDTIAGLEDIWTRGDGKGAGIYRFALPGASLARGGTYRLLVTSDRSEQLTAESTVPAGTPADTATPVAFDRSRDTLRLSWPASPGARSYFVRIETPYGPRAFFTGDTSVRLPGSLRNTDARGIPRVFIPGFQQAVTVSAVDSNFHDWYRSSNNLFTGSGLINGVTGGFGMFGGLVRLRFEDVRVRVPQVEPGTGRFVFDATSNPAPPPYLAIELYVESRATRDGQADALSGRYEVRPRFGYSGCLTCGIFGSLRGAQVSLALLRDWSGRDTVETFTGTVRGDTLTGTYRNAGGIWRFVRER